MRKLIILIYVLSVYVYGAVNLTPNEIERLSVLTSEKIDEIEIVRKLAEERNIIVALYGGTSREIVSYVIDKVNELGSVEAYEKYLKSVDRIHLLDWHKIASDLDIMLIPKELTSDLSQKRLDELQEFIYLAKKEFPGNYFYLNLDIRISSIFLKDPEFDARKQHIEAISNIIISDPQNIGLRLPELYIELDDKKINLTDWGLEQYSKNRLEFRLNPKFKSDDPYKIIRQAFRYIRYISENPDMQVSKESEKAIDTLMDLIFDRHLNKSIELLQEGDKELIGKSKPATLGGKIIAALEKIQIYSGDSNKTRELLDKFRVTELCEEAGVKERRIFEPLRYRKTDPPKNAKTLRQLTEEGKFIELLENDFIVYHNTSISAVQNISEGAVWISNDKTVILGKTTTAGYGDGLYAAWFLRNPEYGSIGVKIYLNPDAIAYEDYDPEHRVILTLDAIAKDENGNLKIEKVNFETLKTHFKNYLFNPNSNKNKLDVITRGLASLFSPESYEYERKEFLEILSKLDKMGLSKDFISEYFRSPQKLKKFVEIYLQDDIFADEVKKYFDWVDITELRNLENLNLDNANKSKLFELFADMNYMGMEANIDEILKSDKKLAQIYSTILNSKKLSVKDYLKELNKIANQFGIKKEQYKYLFSIGFIRSTDAFDKHIEETAKYIVYLLDNDKESDLIKDLLKDEIKLKQFKSSQAGKDYLDKFLKMLNDNDNDIVKKGLDKLKNIYRIINITYDDNILLKIVQLIETEDDNINLHASNLLSSFKKLPIYVQNKLEESLYSKSLYSNKYNVIFVLQSLKNKVLSKKAIDTIISLVSTGDKSESNQAADTMRNIMQFNNIDNDQLNKIIELLYSNIDYITENALSILDYKNLNKAQIKYIINLIVKDNEHSLWASQFFVRHKITDEDILQEIIELLYHDNKYVVGYALEILNGYQLDHKTIQHIVNLIKSGETSLAFVFFEKLKTIDQKTQKMFIALLDDKDHDHYDWALRALHNKNNLEIDIIKKVISLFDKLKKKEYYHLVDRWISNLFESLDIKNNYILLELFFINKYVKDLNLLNEEDRALLKNFDKITFSDEQLEIFESSSKHLNLLFSDDKDTRLKAALSLKKTSMISKIYKQTNPDEFKLAKNISEIINILYKSIPCKDLLQL
jgi:succinate dehydrogenase flavin-adding protein (antitoxin of CptAB toxin-antitoxin module)